MQYSLRRKRSFYVQKIFFSFKISNKSDKSMRQFLMEILICFIYKNIITRVSKTKSYFKLQILFFFFFLWYCNIITSKEIVFLFFFFSWRINFESLKIIISLRIVRPICMATYTRIIVIQLVYFQFKFYRQIVYIYKFAYNNLRCIGTGGEGDLKLYKRLPLLLRAGQVFGIFCADPTLSSCGLNVLIRSACSRFARFNEY